MKKLTEAEIAEALPAAPSWKLEGGKISRKWTFADFIQAMVFVNKVAQVAESAGHHPDIDIRYNAVTLGLVTHDADGVTAKDVDMAARLSKEFPA